MSTAWAKVWPGGVLLFLSVGITLANPVSFVLGVLLPIVAPLNPFAWFFGILLVVIAWSLRPQLGSIKDLSIVPAEEFPELRALVDEVARELRCPSPSHLAFATSFSARVALVGLRRTPVLELGVPLLAALGPQARVALVTHQLALLAAGDSTRGCWFEWALATLRAWVDLWKTPEQAYHPASRLNELTGAVLSLLFHAPAKGIARVFEGLVRDENANARDRAGRVASTVSGADGFLEYVHVLASEECLHSAVQRAALGAVDHGVIPELKRQIAELPPSNQRDISKDGAPAKRSLDPERNGRIERELETLYTAIGLELIREYKAGLYRTKAIETDTFLIGDHPPLG